MDPTQPLEAGRATPLQIACYGHIAVMLRRYLVQTGMSIPDFQQHVLGIKRSSTAAYPWFHATNAPVDKHAALIVKALGVPRTFFRRHDPEGPHQPPEPPETLKVPASWASREPNPGRHYGRQSGPGRALALPAADTVQLVPKPPSKPQRRLVRAFLFYDDGTADIRVDAQGLDEEHAKAVARTIMDMGLTPLPKPSAEEGR